MKIAPELLLLRTAAMRSYIQSFTRGIRCKNVEFGENVANIYEKGNEELR